jgi:hypothetical protein
LGALRHTGSFAGCQRQNERSYTALAEALKNQSTQGSALVPRVCTAARAANNLAHSPAVQLHLGASPAPPAARHALCQRLLLRVVPQEPEAYYQWQNYHQSPGTVASYRK